MRARHWDVAPELLCTVDSRGRIERVNPTWERALGPIPKRPRDAFPIDLLHPDDAPHAARALGTAAPGEDPVVRFEGRCRGIDGAWRWLSWAVVRADGRLHCSARDVTADRAREVEFAAVAGALRRSERLATIGRLAGGIAHEFNNLLMALQSSVELLGESVGGSDADGRELVDDALAAAARGASLVRRLPAPARGQPLSPAATDVGALVGAMRGLLAHSLGPGVLVGTASDPGTPLAFVDGARLELAVLSLALGAGDSMGGEGALTVAVGPATLGEGADAAAGDYVRLEITRAGTGGASSGRAAEPWFASEDVREGLGPDPSMVRELCLRSGGAFRQGVDGAGATRAEILLPAVRPPAARTPAEAEAPRRTGASPGASAAAPSVPPIGADGLAPDRPSAVPRRPRTLRVLVVDDDELVLSGMVRLLGRLGHDAMPASSGAMALRLLGLGGEVDVLLTDQMMPGMTGLQLAVEAQRARPALPVVLSSGYGEPSAADGGRIAAHLRKPFDRQRLERVLARVCAH